MFLLVCGSFTISEFFFLLVQAMKINRRQKLFQTKQRIRAMHSTKHEWVISRFFFSFYCFSRNNFRDINLGTGIQFIRWRFSFFVLQRELFANYVMITLEITWSMISLKISREIVTFLFFRDFRVAIFNQFPVSRENRFLWKFVKKTINEKLDLDLIDTHDCFLIKCFFFSFGKHVQKLRRMPSCLRFIYVPKNVLRQSNYFSLATSSIEKKPKWK